MLKGRCISTLLAGSLALLIGCTSEIKRYDQNPNDDSSKLALQGEFCADDPSNIELPIKILFVVDQSGSQNTNDPDYCRNLGMGNPPPCAPGEQTNMRQEAMRQIWQRYIINPSYYFGIVTFGAAVVPITRQTDGTDFIQSYDVEPYISSVINPTGSTTDLYHALETSKYIIGNDLARLPAEDRKKQRYVMILLTDGIPDDGDGEPYPTGGAPLEDKDSIVNMAESLMSLKSYWGAGDITINTAFVTTNSALPEPSEVFDARDLMQSIQLVGNGVYSEFNPALDPTDIVTFQDYDLKSFIRTFAVKSFVAYNLNSKIDPNGSLLSDSDADGLTDADDNKVRGYADSFLKNSDRGLATPEMLAANAYAGACADFAESALGTNPNTDPEDDCSPTNIIGADTDGDTCPDTLENIVRTDALDNTDCNITMFIDRDGDGCSDFVESTLFPPDPSDPDYDAGADGLNCSPSILRDTDLDGCRDFVEVALGSDSLSPFDCDCPDDKTGDTDADSLLDCEEEILGYATTLFDSDRDGLTDIVEFYGGSNPVSLDEGYLDTDMDSYANNTEVREHTNPKYSDGSERGSFAYSYDLTNNGISTEGVYCYTFNISNIVLSRTQADSSGRDGINHVVFYIIETPQDVNFANDQGIMRVQYLTIRYRGGNKFLIGDDGTTETPLGSTITYTDEDIKDFTIIQ